MKRNEVPHKQAPLATDRQAACTGFGDCACERCYPTLPDTPLAGNGKPLGLWRSLWIVLRGARFYD